MGPAQNRGDIGVGRERWLLETEAAVDAVSVIVWCGQNDTHMIIGAQWGSVYKKQMMNTHQKQALQWHAHNLFACHHRETSTKDPIHFKEKLGSPFSGRVVLSIGMVISTLSAMSVVQYFGRSVLIWL